MIVLVKDINGIFYLDKNLNFKDSITESCYWDNIYTKEDIIKITEKDRTRYEYEILEIREWESEE